MASKFSQENRGFTLIELLTAVSIFSIIVVISMGSIIGIFDANRKTRSMKTAISNLNLAVESMSKEVRFGKNYHCGGGNVENPQNCQTGDSTMSFLSSNGTQITYRLNNNTIEKKVGNEGYVAITAPELVVDSLVFYTLGAGTGDTRQPRVLVKIKSHAGSGRGRTDFTLQTLMSQRARDI